MEMHRTCAALACHLIGDQEMPPALPSTGFALSHLPTRVPAHWIQMFHCPLGWQSSTLDNKKRAPSSRSVQVKQISIASAQVISSLPNWHIFNERNDTLAFNGVWAKSEKDCYQTTALQLPPTKKELGKNHHGNLLTVRWQQSKHKEHACFITDWRGPAVKLLEQQFLSYMCLLRIWLPSVESILIVIVPGN